MWGDVIIEYQFVCYTWSFFHEQFLKEFKELFPMHEIHPQLPLDYIESTTKVL